ncbi:N-glycosylase/DNA lyase [Candidatus Pacearchaeota archaeon]|nr:N-glycosylase/DNA lyase [Candidatus Pacearchaeota archaeon]
MKSLISCIEQLKKEPIAQLIKKRMKEFESIRTKGKKEIFRELCFCILTAGTSAELGIKTINHLGDIIFIGTLQDIEQKLKEVYRFHKIRARYIFDARTSFGNIDLNAKDIREQLVKNIKGIGLKEASHFLRNIGFRNYAIIDFHILDVLSKNNLIQKPKNLSKKTYLEIEEKLKNLAKEVNLSLGEMDLYLWYLETGKILK